MDNNDKLPTLGEFLIGDQVILGELKIDNADTILRLHSEKYIRLHDIVDRLITGELSNHRKVSLIDCNLPPAPGTISSGRKTTYFSKIFPHFVVIGRESLFPNQNTITSITWHISDLSSAFYDFDAFGTSLNPERFIWGNCF